MANLQNTKMAKNGQKVNKIIKKWQKTNFLIKITKNNKVNAQ